MNFNSPEFLLFFPVVLLLHWLLPHRYRWTLLLAASWLFYCWWEPRAGLLLGGTTVVSWLCARQVSRTEGTGKKRLWLVLALTVSLGCLGVFKYAGFFAGINNLALPVSILLPAGISFYTFQTLSYVIDVYRGRVQPEPHFGYYALFVSFFPQLVAGPIERPERLLPQLKSRRRCEKDRPFSGCGLLLAGYFKKVVMADGLAGFVDRVFGSPEAALGPEIVLATVLFGFQIYCDFSGYTDIARGAARLLGIELTENFDRPYTAVSIRDFWNRWHMSLTAWFTDYVYIPMGGSRKGLPRQMVNVMAVFLLSGLWHGADWTFVLWGGLHGLYRICGILWRRWGKPGPAGKGWDWLRRIRTFLLVSAAWLPFRAASLSETGMLLSRLGTGWGSLPGLLPELAGGVLLILCLPGLEQTPRIRGKEPAGMMLPVFYGLTLLMLGWMILLSGSGENAFIYFQF